MTVILFLSVSSLVLMGTELMLQIRLVAHPEDGLFQGHFCYCQRQRQMFLCIIVSKHLSWSWTFLLLEKLTHYFGTIFILHLYDQTL